MNLANQPAPNSPDQSARRLSATTLILSLALVVSTTAAIVLGVLYFLKSATNNAGSIEQHGIVSPKGKFTDTVIYAIPYRSSPNLKLISAKRPFEITKQDEKGFTWEARPLPDDIKDGKGFGAEMLARRYSLWYLLAEGYLGPIPPSIEDFTWEANGLRATEDSKPKPQ